MTKSIMIVGVGGQGTLLTSRILGGVMENAGYKVKVSEVHGMAQRGGSVVTFVRYGDTVAEPIVEEGQADVLIAFERLEAMRYAHFLKADGVLIVNDWRIDPIGVVTGAMKSRTWSSSTASTAWTPCTKPSSSATPASSTTSCSAWPPGTWISPARNGSKSSRRRFPRRPSRSTRRPSWRDMNSKILKDRT